MVRVPLANNRSVCIDTTEVTRAQYAAFVSDSNGHDQGTRLDACGKAPFRDDPDAACSQQAVVCKGDCAAHPQVCVTHCNAQAFCAWAGKRLCSTVKGVTPDAIALGDARVAEWIAACGNGAGTEGDPRTIFPYGSSLDSAKCNTDGHTPTGCAVSPGSCGTLPTGSLQGCRGEGASDKVFDMSGNVHEWMGLTDESAKSPVPRAQFRGGSFSKSLFDPSGDFACVTSGGSAAIDLPVADIGIRCCAD